MMGVMGQHMREDLQELCRDESQLACVLLHPSLTIIVLGISLCPVFLGCMVLVRCATSRLQPSSKAAHTPEVQQCRQALPAAAQAQVAPGLQADKGEKKRADPFDASPRAG